MESLRDIFSALLSDANQQSDFGAALRNGTGEEFKKAHEKEAEREVQSYLLRRRELAKQEHRALYGTDEDEF